jgi:hypothetical protein
MSISVRSTAVVPVGVITQTAATIGPLTQIAGVSRSAFGRFTARTATGINGGVPNQGPFSATLLTPAAVRFLPPYAPVKFIPVVGSVNGVTEPWLLGSFVLPAAFRFLTPYTPVKFTPVAGSVNGVTQPWLMGSFVLPRRFARGLLLVAITPVVYPPMIVISIS